MAKRHGDVQVTGRHWTVRDIDRNNARKGNIQSDAGQTEHLPYRSRDQTLKNRSEGEQMKKAVRLADCRNHNLDNSIPPLKMELFFVGFTYIGMINACFNRISAQFL